MPEFQELLHANPSRAFIFEIPHEYQGNVTSCHNMMSIDGSYSYFHERVQGPECECVHVCVSARTCAGGTEQSRGARPGGPAPPHGSPSFPGDSIPQARHGPVGEGGARHGEAMAVCGVTAS